jgi:hypothetical protein
VQAGATGRAPQVEQVIEEEAFGTGIVAGHAANRHGQRAADLLERHPVVHAQVENGPFHGAAASRGPVRRHVRETRETVVDAAFMRSLIEPLLGDDRSTFRRLLGAIAGVLIQLESAGQDGRLENLEERSLYWELKAVQWALNGMLQVSRSRASRSARTPALSA